MTRDKRQETSPGKIIYYELIRIIAIFAVLFNHSGTLGFQLYSITDNKFTLPIYILCSVICKTAVPLFFMISGALLLGKEEGIEVIYKKRVLRMVIALLLFSLLAYIKENSNMSIMEFVNGVIEGNISSTYWYLYAYICFLISLPLIRKLVIDISIYRYVLVLCIVFSYIIPLLRYICHINIYIYINLPMLSMFILYPLMGYLLSKIELTRKIKLFIIFMGILSAATSVFVVSEYIDIDRYSQVGLTDFSVFIVMAIFIICKDLDKYINGKSLIEKCIIWVGQCTFGIYLLEPIIIRSVVWKVGMELMEFIPSIIAASIGCLCAVGVGTIVVFILKKVPYVNKLL